MKQLRTLALLAVCTFALSAIAQQTPPPDTHEGHGQGQGMGHGMGHGQGMDHKMPSSDEMVQTMTEKLGLTDAQKPKVKAIAEDMHKKMETISADKSLSRDDRMAKMHSEHEKAMSQMRTILTDDQKKKLDEWQKDMQDHKGMHDHQGMHDHEGMHEKKDSKSPQTDDRVQK